MADPVSWAAIAGVAGAGISASSTIAGANRSASASNAMADLAPFNFMLAQKQAENARLQGQYQKQSLKWQGDTALASAQGQQRDAARRGKIALSNLQAAAAFGGGNASSADVINAAGLIGGQSRYEQLINLYNGQVARNAAIDQGNIAEWAANQKAAGLQSQGIQALAQGSIDRANASIIRNNGYATAAGTLLGSAAQMGLSYKQAGGNLSKSVNDIASNYWSPFPSNNYTPKMA